MGGSGSGRHGSKRKVGELLYFDVLEARRLGWLGVYGARVLSWKRGDQPSGSALLTVYREAVRLGYTRRPYGGEAREVAGMVELERTPCRFGGSRPWLVCPRCGRRVVRVYLGSTVACRVCHRLAYPSQSETDYSRQLTRAHRLLDRLEEGKPPRMRWATYERLDREAAAAWDKANAHLPAFVRRLTERARR